MSVCYRPFKAFRPVASPQTFSNTVFFPRILFRAKAAQETYDFLSQQAREGDGVPVLSGFSQEAAYCPPTRNEAVDGLKISGWPATTRDAPGLRIAVAVPARRFRGWHKSYAINPENVQRLNRHHLLKVHHDDHGHIIDIEALRERS